MNLYEPMNHKKQQLTIRAGEPQEPESWEPRELQEPHVNHEN